VHLIGFIIRKKNRLRWMNYVELDFRNVGMRTRAVDRTEWASVARKAKAKLKGLLCCRIRSKKFSNNSGRVHTSLYLTHLVCTWRRHWQAGA